MTALLLATKSHFSFLGSCVLFVREEIFGAYARFGDAARGSFAIVLCAAAVLLLLLYAVSVNMILGEGNAIGVLERAVQKEEIALLDAETAFAAKSSVEQLKKYDAVSKMIEAGRVVYVRMDGSSFVDALPAFP
jgi:hypothetical protein